MKKIDRKKLKNFQAAVDRCSRSTPIGGGLYGSNCEKSIFVGRWSCQHLANRCFKLKVKDKVYYAMLLAYTSTTTSSKGVDKSVHGGFEYALSWRTKDYKLIFRDERLDIIELEVNYNDLLRLEYEEITKEKYFDIVKIFLA